MTNAARVVTDEITLRLLQIEDAPAVFATVDAHRTYLRHWLPWVDANVSLKESEAFIKTTHQQYQKDQTINGAIFYQGAFVGMCGYHGIQSSDHSVSIGYWLSPDYQGRGIVTTCVRFLIYEAFQQLNMHAVRISHAIGNSKSQAVIQACGFTYEGTLRSGEFINDHYVDVAIYSILKSEWCSANAY